MDRCKTLVANIPSGLSCESCEALPIFFSQPVCRMYSCLLKRENKDIAEKRLRCKPCREEFPVATDEDAEWDKVIAECEDDEEWSDD